MGRLQLSLGFSTRAGPVAPRRRLDSVLLCLGGLVRNLPNVPSTPQAGVAGVNHDTHHHCYQVCLYPFCFVFSHPADPHQWCEFLQYHSLLADTELQCLRP